MEEEKVDELSDRAELLVIGGIREEIALTIDAFTDVEDDEDAYFKFCDARMNKLHVDGYHDMLKDNDSVIANFSTILREFGFGDVAIGILKPPSNTGFRDWVINWIFLVLCRVDGLNMSSATYTTK